MYPHVYTYCALPPCICCTGKKNLSDEHISLLGSHTVLSDKREGKWSGNWKKILEIYENVENLRKYWKPYKNIGILETL